MSFAFWFKGLRGAMAFGLAIRNTLSTARQLMLSATSVIVIVSVFICGGSTSQVLAWLEIK
jgi:sodium/hydrogen exchanger-like protein 6/7